MFAVFKTGGKQYRVAAEDVLKVDKVKGEPGEIVEFGEVLVVGGDSVTLGAPTVAGATVAAEVLDQARGPKIIAFKKRRRKNSRRKRGHRQEFTLCASPRSSPTARSRARPRRRGRDGRRRRRRRSLPPESPRREAIRNRRRSVRKPAEKRAKPAAKLGGKAKKPGPRQKAAAKGKKK